MIYVLYLKNYNCGDGMILPQSFIAGMSRKRLI
jgi:hypothetical protein